MDAPDGLSSFAPLLLGHSLGRIAIRPGALTSAAIVQRQGAPTPPLTDAQQWEQDWINYPAQQHYFRGNDRPSGAPRQRYDLLCPLYKAHGIPRPMVYLATSITTAKFYHFSTPAHNDLATALAVAERTLKGKGYAAAPVTSVWALSARTTSKGGWSNHADGRAVDIDPNANPHLVNPQERKVISLLTGVDIEKGGQGYDGLKGASDQFKARYNSTGLQQRIVVLKATEETRKEERDRAKSEHDTLKEERHTLKSERAERQKQLSTLPRGKKANADDAAKAATLKTIIQRIKANLKQVEKEIKEKAGELKKKEAVLKGASKERALIEKQLASYQGTEQVIANLENAIQPLPAEITQLENQIAQSKQNEETATANKDAEGAKAEHRLRRQLQQALKQKRDALQRQQKQLTKKKKQRAAEPLRQYAAHGFLNLSKDVVDALTGAGLKWGGNWAKAKDFMHFEL